jgi:hypothetical protein
LRNRNDFGVVSTYSSMSMYSIARSRVKRSGAFVRSVKLRGSYR